MASDMDATKARLLEWAGSRQVRLTLPAVASWVRALLAENERLEKRLTETADQHIKCDTEHADLIRAQAAEVARLTADVERLTYAHVPHLERAEQAEAALAALKQSEAGETKLRRQAQEREEAALEELRSVRAALAAANEALRVLQEATRSNNTENPWLGVCASVALLQMDLAAANERAEQLEGALAVSQGVVARLRDGIRSVPAVAHLETGEGASCSCGWTSHTKAWRAHAAHMKRRGETTRETLK